MRDRTVVKNVDWFNGGRTLVAALAVALCGSVSLAQGLGNASMTYGSSWQVPPPRQSAGSMSAGMAQRDARPTRIAMLNGDVVMDGDVIMEDGSQFSGSMGMMSEPCNSCRMPPWHGNVCGRDACGPVCEPCDPSYRRACFPRAHALFSKGYIASPMPPCEPRCKHCGMPVPVGF